MGSAGGAVAVADPDSSGSTANSRRKKNRHGQPSTKQKKKQGHGHQARQEKTRHGTTKHEQERDGTRHQATTKKDRHRIDTKHDKKDGTETPKSTDKKERHRMTQRHRQRKTARIPSTTRKTARTPSTTRKTRASPTAVPDWSSRAGSPLLSTPGRHCGRRRSPTCGSSRFKSRRSPLLSRHLFAMRLFCRFHLVEARPPSDVIASIQDMFTSGLGPVRSSRSRSTPHRDCTARGDDPQAGRRHRCPGWHRQRLIAPFRWVCGRFSGMPSPTSR